MEVIRASVMGFCMGVKRAVDKAEQALSEAALADGQPGGGCSAGGTGSPALGETRGPAARVFSLGPLIHNPTVLADFEKRGLSILTPDGGAFPDVQGASVLIRAHGTTPQVIAELEQAGAKVIDATCPKVHLSQKRAGEWSSRGYAIVIAGDRNHGEVTSIASFAKGSVFVVQNAEEADRLLLPDACVLIAQTTFSPAEFDRIRRVLQEKLPGLQVFNSICSATMERQDALGELAEKVEGIIVIGGKASANTRRLYERAKGLVRRAELADLIEDASMIKESFFQLERVGITAGASTPEAVVRAVEERLLSGRPV